MILARINTLEAREVATTATEVDKRVRQGSRYSETFCAAARFVPKVLPSAIVSRAVENRRQRGTMNCQSWTRTLRDRMLPKPQRADQSPRLGW